MRKSSGKKLNNMTKELMKLFNTIGLVIIVTVGLAAILVAIDPKIKFG